MRQHTTGFTLVELVVVLVLLGILSAYAAPKFSGRSGYSELTVRQDLKQSLRYAQQLAMSQTDRTTITLVTSTALVSKIDVLDNGTSVGGDYPKIISNDVTLSDSSLTFDRLGATANADITVIRSAQVLTVRVIGTTGYAYDL